MSADYGISSHQGAEGIRTLEPDMRTQFAFSIIKERKAMKRSNMIPAEIPIHSSFTIMTPMMQGTEFENAERSWWKR
jgi:hypothetical protein